MDKTHVVKMYVGINIIVTKQCGNLESGFATFEINCIQNCMHIM